MFLNPSLTQLFYFLTWRDTVEILFFSSLFYYFSLWLRKDRQKPLLHIFYSYCFVTFSSYAFGLSTISSFLFIFSPAAVIMFIVLHQDMLQKNFVTLHTLSPRKESEQPWLEILMRSALVAINKKKELYCIIERNDSLETLLRTPILLNSPIQHDLLKLLIESEAFEYDKMMWINQVGQLVGLNAEWLNLDQDQWLSDSLKEEHQWKQDAVFFTKKTDCLIFKMNAKTRNITIIAQGKILEDIQASDAYTIINRHTGGSQIKTQTEKDMYETQSKKRSHQQPTA